MPRELLQPEFKSHESDETSEEASVVERSPAEIRELKEKLAFVAKSLSEVFELKLIPGRGWAASLPKEFEIERRKYPEKDLADFDPALLVPEIMTYPEKDLLTKSEDYIWGVFRHEIGHFHHSDYHSLLKGQELAKGEGYVSNDFFMVYNAWEDGRSNEQEAKESATARFRLGCYLKDNISEVLLHNFEKRPLPIQYGLLTWAKGAEPFIEDFDFEAIREKISDEAVLGAYENTEDILGEYLQEADGRKAFQDILWEKGWPIFKELIDKYLEDESKDEHKKDQENNEGEVESEEGGEGETGEDGEGEGKPEPIPDWDDLSDEQKQEYIDKARKKLNEEEAKIIEILKPKSLETEEQPDGTIEITIPPVDPEDVAEAKRIEEERARAEAELEAEIEAAKEEDAAKAREELDRLKERKTDLEQHERSEYESYHSQVRKHENLLVTRLDEIFPPQEGGEWEGGHRRGKRVDSKNLAREISIGRGKFFEQKEQAEIKEAAFTLLIDVSGSMQWDNRIAEALKAAILMAEAFSQKGIPFEILAFNSNIVEIKKFDEQYSGKIKSKLME
ncbi:MAG: hypothetical protein HOE40_02430, partial [Candidatus Pacebacteria bacterium]|nr:hypothetical protein [Candidatus Paceibacterota bacterium]